MKGRKVILVPDLNMEKNWNDKAEMLTNVGVGVSVFDMEQLNPSELDRQAGLDIADFILRAKPSDKGSMYREFEEIKRHWRKNNPEFYHNFMKLYNDFDCEVISIQKKDYHFPVFPFRNSVLPKEPTMYIWYNYHINMG